MILLWKVSSGGVPTEKFPDLNESNQKKHYSHKLEKTYILANISYDKMIRCDRRHLWQDSAFL